MQKIISFSLVLTFCVMAYGQTTTQDQTIDKDAATLFLGNGGDTGPHGIVFDDDGGSPLLKLVYRTSLDQLRIEPGNNSNSIFSIDAGTKNSYFSGNIGIGNQSPNSSNYTVGHILTIGENNPGIIELSSNLNSNTIGRIDFYGNGVSKKLASITAFKSSTDDGQLRFYTQPTNGTIQEVMRLDKDGKLGIGTTSPRSTLDVFGNTGLTISDEQGSEFWSEQVVGAGDLHFYDNAVSGIGNEVKVTFQNGTGNVGIGTVNPQSKLAVEGQIRATEVKILADINVPDYVFEPDYELRTLKETKEYITENKHLPEIPSASKIEENGIDLGDMNMRLLKKIEELTLYQIELMEQLEQQNAELQHVKKELQELKK